MNFKLNQFQIDALNNTAMLNWGSDTGAMASSFGIKFDAPPSATREEMERAAKAAAKRDLEDLIRQIV